MIGWNLDTWCVWPCLHFRRFGAWLALSDLEKNWKNRTGRDYAQNIVAPPLLFFPLFLKYLVKRVVESRSIASTSLKWVGLEPTKVSKSARVAQGKKKKKKCDMHVWPKMKIKWKHKWLMHIKTHSLLLPKPNLEKMVSFAGLSPCHDPGPRLGWPRLNPKSRSSYLLL